jgi:hypothetical protein
VTAAKEHRDAATHRTRSEELTTEMADGRELTEISHELQR